MSACASSVTRIATSAFASSARAADAFLLDAIVGVAQAGGVDEGQRDAVEIDRLAQHVARGAGNVGDDRALGGGERVEQARFAGVRAADDDHVQAVGETCAAARAGEHVGELRAQLGQSPGEFGRGEEIDFLFGKVDRGLDPDAQADRRLGDRAHAIGERAVETAHRRPRGRFGAGRDQIGDRFGLGQIEASVEERALGEFAGSRLARAELDHAREQPAQCDRAAVRLQLDDVLAGERMRRREVDQQAVIDRLAVGIEEPAEMRVARPRRAAE